MNLPTNIELSPPLLCTGSHTLMADFMLALSNIPSEGLCGICGQRVPLYMHDFTLTPHGYVPTIKVPAIASAFEPIDPGLDATGEDPDYGF